MPDDKLSAALDDIRKRWEVFGDASDVPRLLAAVDAVLDLHKPTLAKMCNRYPHSRYGPLIYRDAETDCPHCAEKQICEECGTAWPCPTCRALLGEDGT